MYFWVKVSCSPRLVCHHHLPNAGGCSQSCATMLISVLQVVEFRAHLWDFHLQIPAAGIWFPYSFSNFRMLRYGVFCNSKLWKCFWWQSFKFRFPVTICIIKPVFYSLNFILFRNFWVHLKGLYLHLRRLLKGRFKNSVTSSSWTCIIILACIYFTYLYNTCSKKFIPCLNIQGWKDLASRTLCPFNGIVFSSQPLFQLKQWS